MSERMEGLELRQDIHTAERQLFGGEGLTHDEALEKLLAGLLENLTTPAPPKIGGEKNTPPPWLKRGSEGGSKMGG